MKKRPVGVIVFGILLILSSLDQLRHIPIYSEYRLVNSGLPEIILLIRFLISYILRILGLASGIGVLFLSNRFRKLLIGLSYFSILTVWLRHTYNAQLFYSEPIYRHSGSMFSLETFTWIAVIIRWVIEVAFSSAVLYYFTRPKVVGQFK